MPVVSVCLSPGLQRSVVIDVLQLGEVNRLRRVYVDVSGKGINVSRVLQRLGIATFCLAPGGDNGDEIMAHARSEALDLRLIPSPGYLRTCTTIVESGAGSSTHRVTELVEPCPPVDAPCIEAMTAAVDAALLEAPALVIAGSVAPGFPPGYQARLASMARARGIPVCVDIQGTALLDTVATQPAIVKINLSEFAATFLADRFKSGEHSGELATPILGPAVLDAVAETSRKFDTTFVLTRGANSILLARNGELRGIPVQPLPLQETMNPIGSGDAFLAGLLAYLLRHREFDDWRRIPFEILESATCLASACARSNARTLRPGFLEEDFVPYS
jgi:fructose-1-phosphate kinase PfkB-like protein